MSHQALGHALEVETSPQSWCAGAGQARGPVTTAPHVNSEGTRDEAVRNVAIMGLKGATSVRGSKWW